MNRKKTVSPAMLLHTAAQSREADRRAMAGHGGLPAVSGSELMRRAGEAAWHILRAHWGDPRSVLVCCGGGNNAGDGFVLATLARQAGKSVQVLCLTDAERLSGDARLAWEAMREAGVVSSVWTPAAPESALHVDGQPPDVVVDALFGTGLDRAVEGVAAEWIDAMRKLDRPVLALDLPSGLDADTGKVWGTAVRATATVSFIRIKRGLLTAQGTEHGGKVYLADLELPPEVCEDLPGPVTRQLRLEDCLPLLAPRKRDTHKGDFGHLLVVGGDAGHAGAAGLAATAGLRCGAGLVSVATRERHAHHWTGARPELMVHAVEDAADLRRLWDMATVVAAGPGLGREAWARMLFPIIMEEYEKPMVLDADALNLLAESGRDAATKRRNWLLTPHPKEAARLLGCTVPAVQEDRFAAVARLREQYGGAVILKGNGSLVCGGEETAVSTAGNPGMASGGMGDVLCGVAASLLAQKWPLTEAAEGAVCLHGEAADRAAREAGERGMLASDLMPWLRRLCNP